MTLGLGCNRLSGGTYCLDLNKKWHGSQYESPLPDKRHTFIYEGWKFNSGNYLFTTDTK